MGRLFVHISMSLDGYISDPEGMPELSFADEEFQRYIDELLQSIDGMVFGRVAFEQLASYWPTAGSEASAVQTRRMYELPKYVLSRTLERTEWHNSHVLGNDTATALAELKQRHQRDLALFAGGEAATSAFAAGVIDELRIIVSPTLLAGGKRLFEGHYSRAALRLTDTRRFASGATLLTYAPVTP